MKAVFHLKIRKSTGQTFDISIREFTITVYLNRVSVQDQLVIPEGKRSNPGM